MPTTRHVSLVQKLKWHVSGNISPTAFAIGDVEGHGDNAFVIGNLVGDLFIFKGNHPEGLPWLTCKGLGTITAVTIGDIRNWGKNSIVVMSAEGLCHIFDIAGLDDENGHASATGLNMSSAPTGTAGSRHGHTQSVYSSTPQQGSFHASNSHINSLQPSIPATPSIRPVPDIHNHHTPSIFQGTSPQPQNTPHGSEVSSITGFNHNQAVTPNNTPVHSHAGSIYSGIGGGARRGSDAFAGQISAAKTTAVLSNLIGTPPTPSSYSQGPTSATGAAGSIHRPRSIGINSAANSPTGTPLLRPQHHSTRRNNTSISGNGATAPRDSISGRTHVRNVGGRGVLEKPNLTLPVPVNINRVYIGDIDGDGLNEIVLARTDRIMHSYSLQTGKVNSPPNSAHPISQLNNLSKFISRASSISTLDSSGLLSPSDDRREIAAHYPSLSSVGRQFYGSTAAIGGSGAGTGADAQENINTNDSITRLTLVEKKRWALDGQIHCLAVTKDPKTKLPILLVAQPGLKFVMVDHEGNISEPVTQIQRSPLASVNTVGPDTPTRVAGGGDVATDILCGTHYVNGEKKDIIGLMSMDGAFALHDLESSSVKVHDLDSTHKIFGFSKLNFGTDYHDRRNTNRKSRSDYGKSDSHYSDENAYNGGDDYENDHDGADADVSEDEGTVAIGQGLDGYVGDENPRCPGHTKSRRARRRHAPSMLISEPFGSRFPKNDIFVGCSWSGVTFFIDQEFNTTQYDFDARVCAFGAGQYAITPGRNEPCLFYVDFEDNIYVYHNLYIQTEPSIKFQDIFKADPDLVRASQQVDKINPVHQKDNDTLGTTTKLTPSDWSERKVKEFIHDSLYNVNRYEDEFQRLKRLANIEIAKRMAFLEAEDKKKPGRQEAERRSEEEALAAITAEANTSATQLGGAQGSFRGSPSRRPPLTIDNLELSRSKGKQRGQYPGLEISTNMGSPSPQYTQTRHNTDSDDHHSPSSPLSPVSMPGKAHMERRRPSLLVKDVLSHYQGKITPPLKSPTSPSTQSSQMAKDYKGVSPHVSSGSTATLANLMRRFSLKDLGNNRLSRSSSASSESGSSGSGSSQNTITYGHPLLGAPVLTKGKALETKVGKALRINRPVGAPRNRSLGVTGRKTGARSRLSLQQDREDDTEEGEDDQAPSEDGTAETDGDNLLEFDRASRKSIGEDEFQHGRDYEADLAGDDYYKSAQSNEVNEGEEDLLGVYTPSTISPIPSPGRIYANQPGSASEASTSLDSSAYMLAKGLLSPSSRSITGGSMVVTTAATGKTSRHHEHENNLGLVSSFRGHTRRRSGHGLLDAGLSHLPAREIATSTGISSGPNSAGHNSLQDGRRSRAESLLSTGSDIGGMIVPDITLVSSSFTAQSPFPLMTSEPLSGGALPADNFEGEFGIEGNHSGKEKHSSEIKQPVEDQERSSATKTGSEVRRPPQRSSTLGSQDGTGSGSDTASTKTSTQKTKGPGAERQTPAAKGGDVKLLPAPLPRSSQHHHRQQSEQQGLPGGVASHHGLKDGGGSSSSHISLPSSGRLTSGGGSGEVLHSGGEGLGWGHGGKSTSTTSSANVSEFGSGPSSPLASNVNAGHAILSHPSTNSYKGFSVLSLPVTSPSPSVASAHYNQYFSLSHQTSALPPQAPGLHSSSSLHTSRGEMYPYDSISGHDDDRVSIRSRTSTFPGDDSDISSVMVATASVSGGGTSSDRHGALGMSLGSTSSSHLVSDSLVRRLEELQQQDRDQEEKKRQKSREDKEKEKQKTPLQAIRPVTLSRANSGASIQSTTSHRIHSGSSQAPTSHGSVTAGSGSGPASGTGTGRGGWEDDQHESTRRLRSRPGLGQGL